MNQMHLGRIGKLTPDACTKWGEGAQVLKACEELAELQVQLCKVLAGSPTTDANVIDEIADVLIMASQLRLIYGGAEVDVRVGEKLDRLEKALNREYA